MGYNIEQSNADSKIQGLGYVTSGNTQISTGGVNLGAGGFLNSNATATAAVQDAASLNLIRFTGVGNSDMNGTWAYIPGGLSFRNTGYDIGAVLSRSAAGQTLTVQIHNPTGATQSIPAITIDMRSYFYTAPW